MSLTSLAVNGLWMATCLPEALRFHWATHDVEAAQRRVLSRVLRRNEGTRFGQTHHFDTLRSAEAYQASVPLSDYETYRTAMEALRRGEDSGLTTERPTRLVPTSGSSSARKLIAYTPALRREFQRGLAPWVVDLFGRSPSLLAGTAYWSISPAGPRDVTSSAVPVGFEDDTAYLTPLVGRLLTTCMAVPPFVAGIPDMDAFRYVTLLFLMKAGNLSFVSVWHPTFLGLLLEPLDAWGERLAHDLEAGRLSAEVAIAPPLRARVNAALGRHPRRAAEIRRVLATHPADPRSRFSRLWPDLKVISCWTDAAARGPAEDLAAAFPHTVITPKGLLATEGMVSVPVGQAAGSALALRSHFVEFLEDNDPQRLRNAWQLEAGRSYAVVLTTGGGLYRYRLGDMVRVTGFLRQCPLLQFTGRCDHVSDLYGEKLNELHVAGIVSELSARHQVNAPFAMLVPDGEPRPDHYALLLAGAPGDAVEGARRLEADLDAALRENSNYDYCRRLGQLKPATLIWLRCGSEEASRRYLAACVSKGQRAGEIKSSALDGRPGWLKALDLPHRERGEGGSTG